MHSSHTSTPDWAQDSVRGLEQRLVAAILLTIVKNSQNGDGHNGVVLHTAETTAALCKVMALVLALSPHARSPAALDDEVVALAVRLQRLTVEALKNNDFKITTGLIEFGYGGGPV